MNSGNNEEEADSKNKYVFFSNPDIIKCAETAVAASEAHQFFQLEKQQEKIQNLNIVKNTGNVKTFENLLEKNPVHPYPFTFITAVKRKLALGSHPITKKAYDPNQNTEKQSNEFEVIKESKQQESFHQVIHKMDFIKPLKVPDLKISPKTLDYSSRDSSSAHEEAPRKFETHSKDVIQKDDKISKNVDRVQRKLDFSLSGASSILNSENIEPLKTPDFSISTSLTKKKEHSRDNFKEKENRSKKIKKDDFCFSKTSDDSAQDKRSRNTKQISKKDSTDLIVGKMRNERFPSRMMRDSELASKKPKNKSFATSTARKDEDRRYRHSSTQSFAKFMRDKSLESKGRSPCSESISASEKSVKSQERIAVKDLYKDAQYLSTSRQSDKSNSDLRSQKLQNRSSCKEPSKKGLEKLKQSASKTLTSSEISEEIETGSDLNASSVKHQSIVSEISSQSQSVKSSPRQSMSHISVPYSTQENSNAKDSHEDSSLDVLLDPRRISFRNEPSSPQVEFNELATPDVNLMFRMKRRKQMLQDEALSKGPRHKTVDGKEEETPMLHPAALHMQFQAELNLLDSFNESLRQVTDVENCLYNAKHEHEKDLIQKQKLANEEVKRQLSSLKENRELETKDANFKKGEKSSESAIYSNGGKSSKSMVRVAEVQTQTANDMATQTELLFCQHSSSGNFEEEPDTIYRRNSLSMLDHSRFSTESIDQSVDLERLEDMSLPSKMRAEMSEISLHETTSSIKTETGTEISISTRDVTCSFNKYLDLEMAQLIKDEKQRYNKIEMLFKSREKTLNDRTKKLVKLEEQKRALRDAGQDSQISSVKKKQRALLLKLQQEKDEMNRLKELHKIASRERKMMLRKQRDMFNPEMSTKNILTKLKRSADNQSPRRLSGPMKGYDIRSNSSMSSLVDSDRSQLERSQLDAKHVTSDASSQKDASLQLQKLDAESLEIPNTSKSDEDNAKLKYDFKSRKFEEKMPRANFVPLKNLLEQSGASGMNFLEDDKSAPDSDDLAEELLRKSKLRAEKILTAEKKVAHCSDAKSSSKRKGSRSQKTKSSLDSFPRTKCDPQMWENSIFRHHGKRSKLDSSDENYQNSILEGMDFNESQTSFQALLKHTKDVKEKYYKLSRSIENEREAKENTSAARSCEKNDVETNDNADVQNLGNISTRSQVSTFTISHHSSGDSEKNFSRSVVIRAHDPSVKNSKKLEQILNAREAALASRRSCVEEWIAWHARLREEENRVARMEQTALKLVSAASKALSYHDTTVSSDTSDVEGRIEELTKKLADRRLEMARLKKEARRQAKQRLRALEANLLNQIKKYDTVINEMRKKLETKKSSIKDSEKLAIESRSVIDFKIPEIPIKRIQEIYKSSDLLRSKSEPVLMPMRNQETKAESTKNYTDNDDQSQASVSRKNSEDRSTGQDSPSGNYTTSDSEEIITQNSDAFETHTSKGSASQSSNASEDIQSEINTLEQIRASTKSQNSTSSDKKSEDISEHIEMVENSESVIFTRNLDSIQLHNKNLNENISTLENDLKSLTEIMSSYSRKSDEKFKSIRQSQGSEISEKIETEKSTTKEISEELSKENEKTSNGVKNEVTITEVSSASKGNTDYEAQSKEILNEIEKSIISDCINALCQEPQSSQLAFEVGMQNLYKDNEALSKDLNSLEADIESISDMISKVIKSKNSVEKSGEVETLFEQDSLAAKSSEIEEVSNLIESVVDSSTFSGKNEQSAIMIHDGSSVQLKFESTSKLTEEEISSKIENNKENSLESENSYQKKEVNGDFLEESADLKETDVDSLHEFDASRELIEQHSNNWTISDSFEIQNVIDKIEESNATSFQSKSEEDLISEIGEVSSFVPKGESTNIDNFGAVLEDTVTEKSLNVEVVENVIEEEIEEVNEIDSEKNKCVSELENLEKKTSIVESDDDEKTEVASKKEEREDVSPTMNVTFSVKMGEEKKYRNLLVPCNLIIAELEPNSLEGHDLPELQINAKVELIEDTEQCECETSSNRELNKDIEITECLEMSDDQDSSEGEQMDNLIEVAESGLETLEKAVESFHDTVFPIENDNKTPENAIELEELEEIKAKVIPSTKACDVLRDSEFSDISEESLEVSEILERSEMKKRPRSAALPEKYESGQKSDDVLRTLVEFSKTSSAKLAIEEGTQKNENGGLSESSEGIDTPRGVSEIEMDSPQGTNGVKTDVDTLDEEVPSENGSTKKDTNKSEFHTPTIVSSSEKDIEAMIDKLKASLEQPGLEVAELEAKLLRIEQLQIELEIKKLEAEEVSYYVREIPNKPPPPYTPPSTGRVSTSQSSPSPPPAVVPSNIDELTAFTEKATLLIHNAKQSGKDIMSLEVPTEICELSKDNNEISKRDRKIYNTFLFDLCKEIIASVYSADYEKPGPSWMKPDVQTKAAMKIPRNFEELNECVCKEVALLFGFKTKLQRENMVMRWSRKRRDKVDELLAREAQAEEDEWTKFHHDELTVKNELTVAILDTLLLETAKVVKAVYTEKRKIMV